MTLIVGIRCKDGNLIASDSRAIFFGDMPLMREADQKLEVVGNKFCLAHLGAVAMTSKAVETITEQVAARSIVSSKTFIELCEEAVFEITKKYAVRIAVAEDHEEYDWSIVCATPDGIYDIRQEGISEKYVDYQCFGSSDLYGEYILKQLYKVAPTLAEASKWLPTRSNRRLIWIQVWEDQFRWSS